MSKRPMIRFAALLLAALTLLPLLASANLAHGYINTANHGSVNVRADISVQSERVGTIPYGEQVIIVEYLADNKWVSIEYGDLHGYILARYIGYNAIPAVPAPQVQPTEDLTHIFDGFQAVEYTAVLNATAPGGFVHMRWAPSKKMAILGDYFDGQQFEVIAQNNSWCQIRDIESGKTGFIMRSFLSPIHPY